MLSGTKASKVQRIEPMNQPITPSPAQVRVLPRNHAALPSPRSAEVAAHRRSALPAGGCRPAATPSSSRRIFPAPAAKPHRIVGSPEPRV